MSTITPDKVAQAIVLVVFAAGFVGATHMLKILMLQFGAPDKHIGLATGYEAPAGVGTTLADPKLYIG